MSRSKDFAAHARVADELIDASTKEQLADVAVLLALNCGYYRTKFGDVPSDVLCCMVRADGVNGETVSHLVNGMQSLIAALTEVIQQKISLEDDSQH